MKLYHLILCCFYLLITNTSKAQTDLNKGLIGCYPFSGNANDLSDKSNHGKVTGAGLTADRFGNPNSAYEFDGIDDFIEISPKDLQINSFTYSFWLYPRNLPEFQKALFVFSVGSSYGDQYVLIGNQYPDVLHGIANGSYLGVNYNVRCMTNVLPQLNQWYHIVLSKDAGNYYFYVNGKLLCANPTNGSSAFYGTGLVRATIGARNNYGQAVNAKIDDIHLYNRSVNQSEVDELFKGISLIPKKLITLDPDKPSPCGGEKITIKASTESSTKSFKWKIDGVDQPGINGNEFVYDLPKKSGDYQINISAETVYDVSCFPHQPAMQNKIIVIKDCTLPIEDKKMFFAPMAFTPNGDGKNDTWELFNTNAIPNFEISIYNRWGEIIFHSLDYKTPWNGMYNGTVVSSGEYPYRIYSEGSLLKQGSVMVIQ